MDKTIYIMSFAFAIILGLFTFKETGFLQLLFMGFSINLFACFVLSLGHIVDVFKVSWWRAFLPLIACVLAVIVPIEIGNSARNAYFLSIIPELEKEIEQCQVDEKYPKSIWTGYGIHAYKLENNGVKVIYWWGGGFPVKHTALGYCSTNDGESCFKDGGWRGYALKDRWFILSD